MVSSDMRPLLARTAMSFLMSVPSALPVTVRIPSLSMCIVTLIVISPRGRWGRPLSSNSPRCVLSSKYLSSPSQISMSAPVWLSREVPNDDVTHSPPMGMGEHAGMMVVVNCRVGSSWFAVATPSARGTTSVIWYWWEASMAAPMAMASSGLIRRHSSLPGNMSWRICWTLGMRLEPPTSSTWSTSSICIPPWTLLRARSTGSFIRSSRSPISSSNSSRVILASSVSSW
mmetsp:Transcript_46534/g.97349  ORF Transcript_46534/g.97349 Transcript_46534/m.97349 type:complete len:229 (-) Transcript_46534:904-1590(-)